MATITLDQIRADIEKKYAPLEVDLGDRKVLLITALRLPKDKRRQLFGLQQQTDGDDADAAEKAMHDIVRIIAKTTADGDALLKAVGDDLAVLSEILNEYGRVSQPGEASRSVS